MVILILKILGYSLAVLVATGFLLIRVYPDPVLGYSVGALAALAYPVGFLGIFGIFLRELREPQC